MHNGLERLTTRELECALGALKRNELDKIEKRAWGAFSGLVSEAAGSIERRAPGYMADKIIARCDLNPSLTCHIPAYIAGGKDLLDIAADDGNYSMHHINEVVWPRVREQFRQNLQAFFLRVATGDYGVLAVREHRSRHERVRDLAVCLRWISRAVCRGTQNEDAS